MILKECDVNNDGLISYEEFIQAAIDHKTLLNEKNIKEVFNIFDLNGDGFITLEELKKVLGTGDNDVL